MRSVHFILWSAAICMSIASLANAHTGAEADSVATAIVPLRVYIDCQECDVAYLQQTVTFVSYVRQPAVADVYVLIVASSTVAGGHRVDALFSGRGSCLGVSDTLSTSIPVLAGAEEQRRATARLLWIGLARLVSRCSDQRAVNIPGLGVSIAPTELDRWRGWSGTIALAGHAAGQSKTSAVDGNVALSVSRSTTIDRYSANASWNATSASYDVGDGQTVRSYIEGVDVQSVLAHGVSQHWTVGGEGALRSSSFSNVATQVSVGGGVEYNLYPYTDVAHRQLRARYRMVAIDTQYRELTLFDVTRDRFVQHLLEVSGDRVEIWGRSSGGIEASQYIGIPGAYHVRAWSALSLRVSARLALELSASFTKVHDQREIARAGASLEDVLLQRKVLDTLYDYNATIGITFAVGTIFSSVVNTRFGG